MQLSNMSAAFVVQLRRMENSQPWGFRLRGGADQGIPLHVEHVRDIFLCYRNSLFLVFS
jgi:hypothetical protein